MLENNILLAYVIIIVLSCVNNQYTLKNYRLFQALSQHGSVCHV